MIRALFTLAVAVACGLVASCTQKPAKETLDAVAALRKIQAGTQVGINYQEYGRLLVEAKAKVNDAMRSLPEGDLKVQITGAMTSYADASTVWAIKIDQHLFYGDSEQNKTLIARYAIPLKPEYGLKPHAYPSDVMQLIWLRADIHLNQIDILLKQSGK